MLMSAVFDNDDNVFFFVTHVSMLCLFDHSTYGIAFNSSISWLRMLMMLGGYFNLNLIMPVLNLSLTFYAKRPSGASWFCNNGAFSPS